MSWNYLDFPEEANNLMEMMFESNQDLMNYYREEQREDYQRYAD